MKTPLTSRPFTSAFIIAAVLLLLGPAPAPAVGSWNGVINEPAGVTIEQMILLSDGSVMCQDSSNGEVNWWRLKPDPFGNYVTGSWHQLASMNYARNAYGKTLLRDGRLFVVGDENDGNGTTAEIYNPVTDHWTVLPTAGVGFADSECVILPDGTVLVAPVSWLPYAPYISVIYNPNTNGWSFPTSSFAYQDEASWVKLPDDSILSIDINSTTSERFVPSLLTWVYDSAVPVSIYSHGEMGPGVLLPDGRAFFLGGTGHTALYTLSAYGPTDPGTWVAGPDIPAGRVTADAPGAMMNNGKILCAVGPSAANGGSPAPTWFYEYDYADHTAGTNGTFKATSSPLNPAIGSSNNVPSNQLSFLDLPDGTVLCCSYNKNQLYVYQPDLPPLASGKPAIHNVSWNTDGSLRVSGTLFNGVSQGAAFGDEGQDASNYPIVRFTDSTTGHVHYGRTYDWSNTGVQTGGKIVTTEVSVPSAVHDGPGDYLLQVIANGIASDAVTFFGPVWDDFTFSSVTEDGSYAFPFATMAQGTNAVLPRGTIIIKGPNINAGSGPALSHETMTISKPMTITSVGGAATIGQ
jgi:hypothetical protein